MRFKDITKLFLAYGYSLRFQFVALLLLWPLFGHLLQNSLWRGLADLSPRQVWAVSLVALLFVASIITSANVVLLWGGRRLNLDISPSRSQPPGNASRVDDSCAATPLARIRWTVALLGGIVWVLFLRDLVTQWSWAVFGSVALGLAGGLITAVLLDYGVSCMDLQKNATYVDLIIVPVRVPRYLKTLNGVRSSHSRRLLNVLRLIVGDMPARVLNSMGPGYTDADGRILLGHRLGFVLLGYMLVCFYVVGFHFRVEGTNFPGIAVGRLSQATGSTLLLLLFGVQVLLSALAQLSFYLDRFRVSTFVVLAVWITFVSWVHTPVHSFYAVPVSTDDERKLLTPRQILAASPARMIVAAAAGGGIQASGWTAQVLTGLTEENPRFKESLRVISAVSGGSVGAMFYLGTYPGVWANTPYSLEEARRKAMSSLLEDVAWGLVYPDLHGLFIPYPIWGGWDRGALLEKSLAETAEKRKETRLLRMNSLPGGVPVLIFNATLSHKALPIVFYE